MHGASHRVRGGVRQGGWPERELAARRQSVSYRLRRGPGLARAGWSRRQPVGDGCHLVAGGVRWVAHCPGLVNPQLLAVESRHQRGAPPAPEVAPRRPDVREPARAVGDCRQRVAPQPFISIVRASRGISGVGRKTTSFPGRHQPASDAARHTLEESRILEDERRFFLGKVARDLEKIRRFRVPMRDHSAIPESESLELWRVTVTRRPQQVTIRNRIF